MWTVLWSDETELVARDSVGSHGPTAPSSIMVMDLYIGLPAVLEHDIQPSRLRASTPW